MVSAPPTEPSASPAATINPAIFANTAPGSAAGPQTTVGPLSRLQEALASVDGDVGKATGAAKNVADQAANLATAIQNALRYSPVDEIVISTFEPERSGWLRSDLIERVKNATQKPVEHVMPRSATQTTPEGQAA